MVATQSILSALERNWEMVDSALASLEDSNLARLPADQCNSVAWILWHMSRVVDTFIQTRLREAPQLWIHDGWHRRFDMSDDAEDRGVGWTTEQVETWTAPSRAVIVGYYEAVNAEARKYISSLTAADLEERRVIPPVAEPRTVAQALGQMTWDNVAHGGQIAYLRGFFQGMGWHR